MAIVRIEALAALRTALECHVPDLRDRICVGQAPDGKEQGFPHLSILPHPGERWRFYPDQETEVRRIAPGLVLVNVGRWEGVIQLRIGAATAAERNRLEAQVIDAFLATEGHPGIILTRVTSCELLGEWLAAWALAEDSWDDEKAFDRELYSTIEVDGTIPALTTRKGYTIRQLKLGLTDMTTPALAAIAGEGAEVVAIQPDGRIVPVGE